MIEVAEAHDPVRLSFIRAVLMEAGVDHAVFDTAAQGLWPGAFRARVMTAERDAWLARKALERADAERAAQAP